MSFFILRFFPRAWEIFSFVLQVKKKMWRLDAVLQIGSVQIHIILPDPKFSSWILPITMEYLKVHLHRRCTPKPMRYSTPTRYSYTHEVHLHLGGTSTHWGNLQYTYSPRYSYIIEEQQHEVNLHLRGTSTTTRYIYNINTRHIYTNDVQHTFLDFL